MGSFRYIVSGNKENCHKFLEELPHCYSKYIYDESEYGDDFDFWIWGDCKYSPELWWIKDKTKELSLTLHGSYENEDRESDEAAGSYLCLVNGRYGKEDFADNEMMFLDIAEYDLVEHLALRARDADGEDFAGAVLLHRRPFPLPLFILGRFGQLRYPGIPRPGLSFNRLPDYDALTRHDRKTNPLFRHIILCRRLVCIVIL